MGRVVLVVLSMVLAQIGPPWGDAGVVVAQSPPCAAVDSLAPWVQVNRPWQREDRGWSNDQLRSRLLSLAAEDQADRRDFGSRATDSTYVAALNARDSVRASRAGEVLAEVGLPTRSLVGAAGVDAFMLLVQHSWPLQERVLALARAAPAGGVSPQALAMLEDRVLTHNGKLQRFGTQFTLTPDGWYRFAPTEDVGGLAARRAAAGLPPLADYVCWFEEAGMRVDKRSLPPGP